jgi:hypothetical protein
LGIYTLLVGGDDFAGARFLAPWLPVLLALAGLTPQWLGWRAQRGRYALSLAVLLIVVVGLAGYNFLAGPGNELYFLRAALRLRSLTQPETRIAHVWAGVGPYFSERPAVDLLGKNDAEIARRAIFPGSYKPGHNKFDFEYSLGPLRPDLVISPLHPTWLEQAGDAARYAQGDDAYLGQLYLSPVFQADYAPTLLIVEDVAVFVRAGSSLQRLMTGRCEAVTNPARLALGLRRVCWP